MATYVTRVVLTETDEPSRPDATAGPGVHYWEVEWVKSTDGHAAQFRHAHYTEVAARRHVSNLLQQRPPAVPIEDIYTEHVAATGDDSARM